MSALSRYVGSIFGVRSSILIVLLRVNDSNLTTALILKDDFEWDIGIKEQLLDYALTVRALTQLLDCKILGVPIVHARQISA